MRAAGELQDPVGYADRWLLLAVLALSVVAVYYLAVLWWGRPRTSRPQGRRHRGRREAVLDRLDDIEAQVRDGRITPREGHRRISSTVRGFVADEAGVPARTMTLADLERHGPERLAAVVALVYPPQFAPGDELPRERFGAALTGARELVSSWT